MIQRKLATVACITALAGIALAAPATSAAQAEKSASATKLIKKLKKQVKALETRLAAVEARPTATAGGSPTGAAGGELAGTYPNPTIGTVNGLQLALSDSTNPGVQFGPGGAEMYNVFGSQSVGLEAASGFSVFGTSNLTDDVTLPNATSAAAPLRFGALGSDPAELHRSAANTLHTDDSLDVDGNATVDGNTTLGNAATDQTIVNGFLRLQVVGAPPDAADCDAFGEQGRVVFENSLDRLYVCDALNGWKFVTVGT